MKRVVMTLLLLTGNACWAQAGRADPYFVDSALAPYPPGCVTLPARQIDLYGDNVVEFWSGTLALEIVYDLPGRPKSGPVEARMYRAGCAEPNRSVIIVEFRLPPEWVDHLESVFILPTFTAEGPGGFHYIPFELKPEPNTFGQSHQQQSLTERALGEYTGGWDDARRFTWRYVLDMAPGGVGWPLMAEFYNGAFLLQTFSNGAVGEPIIEVPATADLLAPNPQLPLNGRLSGTWVEPGAADQGFLLTFSHPVPPAGSEGATPPDSELLIFLTWYTFDAAGEPLWLAGNARFAPGAADVTLPLIEVAQGHFLGGPAEAGPGVDPRSVAGEIHLRARSCSQLELDYDLAPLELGAGTFRLERLFALETAGYPCRDYEARLASQSTPPAH